MNVSRGLSVPWATNSFYTPGPKREALATIPLEWHYLMVVWSLSAESRPEDEVAEDGSCLVVSGGLGGGGGGGNGGGGCL